MDAKGKGLDLMGRTAMHGPADLPEHLIFEILSWLPAATLVRFKLVRKSWRDHIESPMFAAKHLRNQNRSSSRSNDSLLLVSQFHLDRNLEYRFSLVSFADDNKDTSNVVKHIDFPFYTGDKYLCASGYCHGILCISGSGHFVALANPGIRQFRVLSGSCIYLPPSTGLIRSYVCHSGFGYDPISCDYKVVRVWQFHQNGSSRVEIYTLSTDSWREINGEPFLVQSEWCEASGKYFNGAFYWWVLNDAEIDHDEYEDSDDGKYAAGHCIIVFDMSKEVFVLVRRPEPYYSMDEDVGWNLLIMNESLVMLSYRCGSLKSFEIQEIHRTGGDKSGFGVTKLETIEPPHADNDVLYPQPLVFWKNGEILFLFRDDARIVSYKKGSDVTKSVPIRLSQKPCEVTAEVYTGSLISVAGGQQLDGGN